MPAPSGGALDVAEEPDPEPIAAGLIAVRRVVFEHLAAAIDPFPRMPDAALERDTATGAAGAPGTSDSPFAVLAIIRAETSNCSKSRRWSPCTVRSDSRWRMEVLSCFAPAKGYRRSFSGALRSRFADLPLGGPGQTLRR